jgi:hypothetical protein
MTPFPSCLTLNTLLLAPMFAACSEPSFICTDESRPAIVVEIRNRVSDEYLSVVPKGVVRDGAFEDSLVTAGETLEATRVATMSAAHERAGTYLVQLEADGYLPWDTSNVRVFADECHVITEEFIARLQPE